YCWSTTDLVMIRSAWNSHLHPVDYLAWAQWVSTQTTLINPFAVLEWNIDKYRYFQELQALGVLLPTMSLSQGQSIRLAALLEQLGWQEVVLKPTISANSYETVRID